MSHYKREADRPTDKQLKDSGSKRRHKMAITKANQCALTHKATDRTAKLVENTTAAQLAKVRPLGLTFFLCNKTIKQSN